VFKRVRVKVMTESQGQQVPWDNSSLTGDFYFIAGGAEPAAMAVAKPVETVQLAALSPNKAAADKPVAAPRVVVPTAQPVIAPVKNDSEERYRLASEAMKRGEVAAALAGFEEAAKKGHALAAYEAGQLYKTGRKPVNQDLALARSYFTKAAPSHPPAALQLGLLYERGQGGEKSCKDAQQWFAKSAERGVVDAMAALGDLLLRSCDGQKNLPEAARWLKLAAEKASTPAMFSLGVLYFNGEGVSKDSAEARKWLSLAAERGHPSAKTYLERLR
jgi:TPR repeat protein